MDHHAPNSRPIPQGDTATRSILWIWLRLSGLLAVLIPLFLGLQHLLEREASLGAEAARAALPTPTPVVVEVPVTVERVVERTVFVTAPAQPATLPALDPVAQTAEAPSVTEPSAAEPPAVEPTPGPVAEALPADPAEPAATADEPVAPPVVQANPNLTARRPVARPPIIAPTVVLDEQADPGEVLDEGAGEDAAEPQSAPEDVADSEARPAFGVLREVGSDSGDAAPVPATPIDTEEPSALEPVPAVELEPVPAVELVEALATSGQAVSDPGQGEQSDGEPDQTTDTPGFVVLETVD